MMLGAPCMTCINCCASPNPPGMGTNMTENPPIINIGVLLAPAEPPFPTPGTLSEIKINYLSNKSGAHHLFLFATRQASSHSNTGNYLG